MNRTPLALALVVVVACTSLGRSPVLAGSKGPVYRIAITGVT